jgi:serine/threonine protein kinase
MVTSSNLDPYLCAPKRCRAHSTFPWLPPCCEYSSFRLSLPRGPWLLPCEYLPRQHSIQHSATMIVDVAEGILHSKGVVWVDASPSNMLLTNEFRIALSDFCGSGMLPKYFPKVQPGDVWVPPNIRRKYYIFTETQDTSRFAFGTLAFVLLLGCYPHCDGPKVSTEEEDRRILGLHEGGTFDHRVSNEGYPVFAEVIQNCWRDET